MTFGDLDDLLKQFPHQKHIIELIETERKEKIKLDNFKSI